MNFIETLFVLTLDATAGEHWTHPQTQNGRTRRRKTDAKETQRGRKLDALAGARRRKTHANCPRVGRGF